MARRASGTPNRGSVALDLLCPEIGDQHRIAAQIGEDEGQFSRWRRGVVKPMGRPRGKMQDSLGIGWSWWDEPPTPEQNHELAARRARAGEDAA